MKMKTPYYVCACVVAALIGLGSIALPLLLLRDVKSYDCGSQVCDPVLHFQNYGLLRIVIGLVGVAVALTIVVLARGRWLRDNF